MDRPQAVNRRQALSLLAGGGAGAAALKMLPDPLEAAQVTTRRGLPRLKITDIAQVAEMAHAAGAICACDNT